MVEICIIIVSLILFGQSMYFVLHEGKRKNRFLIIPAIYALCLGTALFTGGIIMDVMALKLLLLTLVVSYAALSMLAYYKTRIQKIILVIFMGLMLLQIYVNYKLTVEKNKMQRMKELIKLQNSK